MSVFERVLSIELDKYGCVLEVETNADGNARFVIRQRYRISGREGWSVVHTSGLYADAAGAEADGLEQWKGLRQLWLGGMTLNERLVMAGLMDDWDAAVRARDRKRMTAILIAVEAGNQAASIIASVLR